MKEWPTWMPTASIMERWPQFQVYKQHGPLKAGGTIRSARAPSISS